MTADRYHLAHFNIAVARHPLDAPEMAGFTGQLDAVNRLAAESPGFIWTPAEGEAGDAAATFESLLVLANISTWRSLDDLHRFVYTGLHRDALKRRYDWFVAWPGPAYVLWWIPAGHRPNWVEAKQRLRLLETLGPTRQAFTFHRTFEPADPS